RSAASAPANRTGVRPDQRGRPRPHPPGAGRGAHPTALAGPRDVSNGVPMAASSKQRLHLGAIITAGPGTGAFGAWRYPSSEQYRFLEGDYYQHTARTLERGKFDLIFFADKLGLPGRFPKAVEANLRNGS